MWSKIAINKRLKRLPREELEKLEKNELIEKIIQLEAYNFQLKNILNKKLNDGGNCEKNDELLKELRDLHAETISQSKQETVDSECSNNELGVSLTREQKGKKRQFDFSKSVACYCYIYMYVCMN